jgi:hypothetical protein
MSGSRLLRGDAAARQTIVAALAVALGSVSLHAVLTTNRWSGPVLLVIGVVAALGALGRRLGIWPIPVVAMQLVGVAVVCTGLYAHHQAFAEIVPTPASVNMLGTLARAGVNDLRVVLAPTYPNKDLSLLAVAGIGLMTVLVDVLAVDARRPTLAGLPLVLLVAVPAAIRERSVGYLPLLAAAIGFLLLLSLDGQERAGAGQAVGARAAQPRRADALGAGQQRRRGAADRARVHRAGGGRAAGDPRRLAQPVRIERWPGRERRRTQQRSDHRPTGVGVRRAAR